MASVLSIHCSSSMLQKCLLFFSVILILILIGVIVIVAMWSGVRNTQVPCGRSSLVCSAVSVNGPVPLPSLHPNPPLSFSLSSSCSIILVSIRQPSSLVPSFVTMNLFFSRLVSSVLLFFVVAVAFFCLRLRLRLRRWWPSHRWSMGSQGPLSFPSYRCSMTLSGGSASCVVSLASFGLHFLFDLICYLRGGVLITVLTLSFQTTILPRSS